MNSHSTRESDAADDALRAAWDRGYATAVEGMKDVPECAWNEGYQSGLRGDEPQNPFRPAL